MMVKELDAGAVKPPLILLTSEWPVDWANCVPWSWGWNSEPAMMKHPSALGITAETAGQYCRWDHCLMLAPWSWLVLGVWEAWRREGAFQLIAEACCENATILRADRSPPFSREPVLPADGYLVNAICVSAVYVCTALTSSWLLPLARCDDLLVIIFRSGALLEPSFDFFSYTSNLPKV